ncbi:hypothetical protein F5X96DRAFT_371805 [Biscogniauxia mediterranea]|nr:hypothetical protein F5X96DRAFT_371805 [Biscogniauxia mediterranea]
MRFGPRFPFFFPHLLYLYATPSFFFAALPFRPRFFALTSTTGETEKKKKIVRIALSCISASLLPLTVSSYLLRARCMDVWWMCGGCVCVCFNYVVLFFQGMCRWGRPIRWAWIGAQVLRSRSTHNVGSLHGLSCKCLDRDALKLESHNKQPPQPPSPQSLPIHCRPSGNVSIQQQPPRNHIAVGIGSS